eukprot:COSAG02_NODE_56794_length_283_cov_1.570652_1_plen_94_part_11
MQASNCYAEEAQSTLHLVEGDMDRALLFKPLMSVTGLSLAGALVYLERARWNSQEANWALQHDIQHVVQMVPNCSEDAAQGMIETAHGDVKRAV